MAERMTPHEVYKRLRPQDVPEGLHYLVDHFEDFNGFTIPDYVAQERIAWAMVQALWGEKRKLLTVAQVNILDFDVLATTYICGLKDEDL